MLNETKQHFFKKLIEDTFGYYRIYDFVKLHTRENIETTRTFNNSEKFWKAILQDDFRDDRNETEPLRNNQVIKLRNFFLTEWTPKLPGRVWTKNGNSNLLQGIQNVVGQTNIFDRIYNVLGPEGKNQMITGGFGSVRIKPRQNNDYCMLLNAVSVEDWHCDFGIPIVVSKPAYDEYLRYAENEGAPEMVELKGVLCLNNDVNQLQIITPAIGARLDNDIQDMLSDIPNLPKCFIYVSSPLDLSLRYNPSHPEAIAWTMFRTNLVNEPLRLTYARFNPIDNESANAAVAFINRYVFEFNGTEILTDFDGQRRRLISKTSLADTKNFNFEHRRILGIINSWIIRESR